MTDLTNDLAADIREVNGDNKLGAGALAEKLIEKGWSKPSPKDASLDYPHLDSTGETIVLGPEVFVSKDEKVLNWKGRNYVPQGEPLTRPASLKDFDVDEKVEAFKNGSWYPGVITSRDKVSGHLHIHTDRGPVTIATPNGVRKISQE